MITAIRVLLEHGVKEENILLLNVFATPKGECSFVRMCMLHSKLSVVIEVPTLR